MKYIINSFLLCCFCLIGVKRQQPDCKRFKDGTFTITDKDVVYIIERHGNKQSETRQGSTDTSAFVVTWINDCTYRLNPYPDYFVKHPNESKDEMMMITITKTTPNSYFETTTSNFFKGEVSAEVVKIK